jgi:hypothetical protein
MTKDDSGKNIVTDRLVDARTVAEYFGFSVQYINRLARGGVIPYHGLRNGVGIHRRFDLAAVRAALHVPVQPTSNAKPEQLSRNREKNLPTTHNA